MGFRHVNGPARWGSYAKAEYVRKVRSEYDVPLAEIARTIGDRHRTVQRLYRALMVLDQAATARVYSLNDRAKRIFLFHICTSDWITRAFSNFLIFDPKTRRLRSQCRLRTSPIWVSFWCGCLAAKRIGSRRSSEAKIPICVGWTKFLPTPKPAVHLSEERHWRMPWFSRTPPKIGCVTPCWTQKVSCRVRAGSCRKATVGRKTYFGHLVLSQT